MNLIILFLSIISALYAYKAYRDGRLVHIWVGARDGKMYVKNVGKITVILSSIEMYNKIDWSGEGKSTKEKMMVILPVGEEFLGSEIPSGYTQVNIYVVDDKNDTWWTKINVDNLDGEITCEYFFGTRKYRGKKENDFFYRRPFYKGNK